MNCLVVGYYGFGNAGDDWLLEKVKSKLESEKPTMKIWHRFGGKILDPKGESVSWFSAWKHVDTIVLGGGSLFQDKSSFRSLIYYVGICLAAYWSKKQVWMLAQGLGPLERYLSKLGVRQALEEASYVSCRDAVSYEQVKKLCHKKIPPIYLTADLVYYRSEYQPQVATVPLTGLSIRKGLEGKAIQTIQKVCEQMEVDLQGIIADANEDTHCLSTSFPNMTQVSLSQLIHEPVAYTNVITMRYHVAVWASLKGIPFIALSNDPKLLALASDLEQLSMPLTRLNRLSAFKDAVDVLKKQHDALKQKLQKNVPKLIKRANRAIQEP